MVNKYISRTPEEIEWLLHYRQEKISQKDTKKRSIMIENTLLSRKCKDIL